MANFTFKTTCEYADGLCDHKRMFDIREKSKGIQVGDVIRYIPWFHGKEIKGHAVTGKRFGVVYVDHDDPRVMKDFDIFQLVEIVPEFE